MTISKSKLELIMARKKMNKSQLADAAGVSRNRIYTILGQKNATPVAVGRIADALGVDVTEIIDED